MQGLSRAELLAVVDRDNDDNISWEEFVRLIKAIMHMVACQRVSHRFPVYVTILGQAVQKAEEDEIRELKAHRQSVKIEEEEEDPNQQQLDHEAGDDADMVQLHDALV